MPRRIDLKPADVIAPIAPALIAIRPGRRDDARLARNLERIRSLRTSLMARLLAWRAAPFTDWLEGRPSFWLVVPGAVDGRHKRLARWCDVPTPVLLEALASLASASARTDGQSANIAVALNGLVALAGQADGVDHDVRRFIIQHLSELIERQALLRLADDDAVIAALRAHHRLRKAYRDVRKQAEAARQRMVPVPGHPGRTMPLSLTAEQQAHIERAHFERNKLLGIA